MGILSRRDADPVKVRFRVYGEDDLPRTYSMDYLRGEVEFKANEDAYHDILPGRHRFSVALKDTTLVTLGKVEEGTVCLVILKGEARCILFARPDRAEKIWV